MAVEGERRFDAERLATTLLAAVVRGPFTHARVELFERARLQVRSSLGWSPLPRFDEILAAHPAGHAARGRVGRALVRRWGNDGDAADETKLESLLVRAQSATRERRDADRDADLAAGAESAASATRSPHPYR